MLTKGDVEAIQRVVKTEGSAIRAEIKEEINDLEERLEDKIGDVYDSVFNLRTDNSEDHRGIKRRLAELRETFDSYRKIFDEYLQQTRKDVAKIKDFLKLPPVS